MPFAQRVVGILVAEDVLAIVILTVLSAVGRNTAVVINQAVKEKKFKEAEAPSA